MSESPLFVAPHPSWTAPQTFERYAHERGRVPAPRENHEPYTFVGGSVRYWVTLVSVGDGWVFAVFYDFGV